MVDNTPLKPTRDWLKSTRLNYKKRQENWILLALFGHEKQLYGIYGFILQYSGLRPPSN
jgi:hypothetical protein